jgi:hypothetical protein
LTVKSAKLGLTPTPEPFTPPPRNTQPHRAQPLALLIADANASPGHIIEAIVNDAANLREGPGTDFAIVGKAAAGARVQVAGQSENGEWYKLADGAWIAAFLVDPPIAPPPVVAPDAPAQPMTFRQMEATEPAPAENRSTSGVASEAAVGEETSTEAQRVATSS